MSFTLPERLRRRRQRDAGVTLIEMMIVLVIIGVVAAIVVPNVVGRPDQARATVAETDLRTIAASLEMYRLDNRSYPTTEQGLAALAARPTLPPKPPNWVQGGYLRAVPTDPWGRAYVYLSPAQDAGFALLSLGADGVEGGEGVDADVRVLGGIVGG
jgi:general secretion pathway protein G